MSHERDKLIRQLWLVTLLIGAERGLTARDIKSVVEGYSQMSDEEFGRRFYTDRTELISLGVPIYAQRDESTGEECYAIGAKQFFPSPVEELLVLLGGYERLSTTTIAEHLGVSAETVEQLLADVRYRLSEAEARERGG